MAPRRRKSDHHTAAGGCKFDFVAAAISPLDLPNSVLSSTVRHVCTVLREGMVLQNDVFVCMTAVCAMLQTLRSVPKMFCRGVLSLLYTLKISQMLKIILCHFLFCNITTSSIPPLPTVRKTFSQFFSKNKS